MAEKKKGAIAKFFSGYGERTKKKRAEVAAKKQSQTKAGMKAKKDAEAAKKAKTASKPRTGPGTGSILRQFTPKRVDHKKGEQGPKSEGQFLEDRKVKKVGSTKASGAKKIKTETAKADTKGLKAPKVEKKSYAEQLAAKKKSKGKDKASKIMSRADKAAKKGNLKKAARLEKRSKRKSERAEGTRKSAVGTALTKVGRGAIGALAAVGGESAALKKGGTAGSTWKRAASAKKKKK